MTSRPDDQPRLPGTLITIDGPGGVGKSSAATAAVELLTAAGLPVHGTRQPSRAKLGELAVINARLRARGGHSRFKRAVDNSARESALYALAVADLQDKGWPVETLDCTTEGPDTVAARIVSLIYRALGEKRLVCP